MRKFELQYLLLALAVLLVAALPARAEEPVRWQVPILPDRGMYYTPGHGGTGINIDVDPNGFIFATFFTYDHDGNPFYYLMEGQFQPASDIVDGSGREYPNMIGSFDATLYTSKNGECLGTDCVYKNPDRALTEREAHMVWITQRHAKLTIGTQSWDLRAGQYTSTDTDKIVGTWSTTLSYSFPPGSKPTAHLAILKIRKSQYPGTVLGSGGDDYQIYDVACAGAADDDWNLQSTCADFYVALRGRDSGQPGPKYWLLYNLTDGSLRLAPYDLVNGEPQFRTSTAGNFYQVELTPGVMRGRDITFDDTGTYENQTKALDMIRVPDGTVKATAD